MLQAVLSVLDIGIFMVYGVVLLFRRCHGLCLLAQLGGVAVCVALEICDLGALYYPEYLSDWKNAALVAESCLSGAWLCFVLGFSSEWSFRNLRPSQKLLLLVCSTLPLVAFLPVSMLYYSPDFISEKLLFLTSGGYAFYVVVLVLLVVDLFLLEKTLMSLSSQERRQMKLEIIGAGVILSVLIIYYSQALLYRSLDMNLMPVRSMSLAVGAGLMVYSRIKRGEITAHLRVSREIAYRSVVILAMGFYLVSIAVFGTGMSYFNLTGNRVLLISFAVIFGLLMVFAIMSEKVQGRFRVLLHKNFYQQKYDYRQEWMQFTSVLEKAKSREDFN
jgi:hypothetical protein